MRRLYSNFAQGAPGIGLLLLRLMTGSAVIYHGVTTLAVYSPFVPPVFRALLILLGVMLLAGLWTPIAGAALAVITTWEMVSDPASRPQFFWIALIACALALLGPGTWSVDARLYGWKQIKLSDRRRSGGTSPT